MAGVWPLYPRGTPKGGVTPTGCPSGRWVLGVPRPPRGSPEGRSPFGRRYGGCASINHLLFFGSPPFLQEGGQGDGATVPTQESEGVPQAAGYPQGAPLRCWVCRAPKGESRGAQPLWQESEGVPQAAGYPQGAPLRWLGVPRPQGGVQRGTQSLWQEVWRMCLHKPSSFL